jgi:hypothetical protein
MFYWQLPGDLNPANLPISNQEASLSKVYQSEDGADHLRRLPAQAEIIDLAALRIEVVTAAHGTIETLRLIRIGGVGHPANCGGDGAPTARSFSLNLSSRQVVCSG